MIFETRSALREKLIELPETGMGYQIIEGIQEGKYSSQKFVVYNTELAVSLDSDFNYSKRKIISEGYISLRSTSPYIDFKEFQFVPRHKVLEKRFLNESKKRETGRHSGGSAALENPKEYANGEEVFVRLSAYEGDNRIDIVHNKLRTGSYVTTFIDYQVCKKHYDDPVDRYALPYDDKIEWAFYVQPKSYDKLQRGVVQPAFEHDGGGLEAFFEEGTSNNTYLKKTNY